MRTESWRYFDFWLLGAVAVLTIFGIAMINSAIAGNENLTELIPRQIIFAILGFIVLIIAAAVDYRLWTSLGRFLYIGIAILLGLTFVLGSVQGGAARWIDIGLVLIQPSELAKIALILVLADFFSRNQARISDLRWVFRSLLLTLGMLFWIFIQPDLSTSIVLLVIWFALLWATGLQIKHLLLFAGIGLIAITAGFPLLEDYQQQRVFTFLFPNPEARFGTNYNVNQALITIGSGGLFGQGYQQGNQVQLRFLKVRHTDFIFSALAEEFGFVGAILVLALLIFILWRILRAARLARDSFGSLIAYGVATLIFFHTAVNVAMNLNIIPVTGIPLPFISYGGSTLLSILLGVGLVESILLRQKSLEFQ
jgi:rod shape determining protein RodA